MHPKYLASSSLAVNEYLQLCLFFSLFQMRFQPTNIKYVCDGGVVFVTWRPGRPSCDRRHLAAAQVKRALVNQLVGHRQHAFHLIIPSCLLLIIHCKKTCLSILSKNFKHFAWPKIHPRLLPLATGKLLLSVIRCPGIWSIIATDSISQMFYNYYQWLLCHNFFIIIISDYHLSINSQLLWPARCPNIWSIVTDSISQVTQSKSGEIRNQSLQAVCLQRTLWFLFNRMFMPVLWQYIHTYIHTSNPQEHIINDEDKHEIKNSRKKTAYSYPAHIFTNFIYITCRTLLEVAENVWGTDI